MNTSATGYTVLVDGYNVIKRHGSLTALPLKEARRQLVTLVGKTRWPIAPARVLVVFDASRPSDLPALPSGGRVQIHFATPSADAYIQTAIRSSAAPHRLGVVSDDGAILRTAKSHGAHRYTTQWFIEHSTTNVHTRRDSHNDDATAHTTLPASTARQITDELAKRWLDSSSGTS